MSSRTIYDVLEKTTSMNPRAAALYQPLPGKGEVKYRTYTWSEYKQAVEEIACGLREMGIGKGDIVALDSETRAEFYLADVGVMANGSIAAALYTSYPADEHVKTLAICKPKAIFVEDPNTRTALLEAGVPADLPCILLTGQAEGCRTLDKLREEGRSALRRDPALLASIRSEVKPEDYAVLYLTSGATGEPKLGLTTHAALVSNIDMGPAALGLTERDRTVVFLPSAHIAQRVVLELLPIRCGTPVWFSESLSKLPNELKRVRPTFFLAPPRVWERIYASISTEIRKRPAVTRKLFYGALGLGLKAAKLRREGRSLPPALNGLLKVANRAIFSKIRERLGGELRVAASGAAPLGKELAEFYEAIGMPLIEGYGLTEGGVATLNPLDRPKPGSIGKPLQGVEVKVGEDGELLIKSPCLFSEYFNDPSGTAAVLKDGWLRTGDLGEIDSEGYVFVTGRKKEMIVSSNGKKIYPLRIEGLFKTEPLINQIVLVGDRLPYVAALFTVNTAAVETLKGVDAKMSPAALATSEPVQQQIRTAVARANERLAPFEQIRKFRVLERDFTIERGELTPTMKIRRAKVLENFRATVDELYAGKEESR